MVGVSTPWRRIGVPAAELRLAHTLPTGQCFGWERVGGRAEWRGCLGDTAVALREARGTREAEWRCDAVRADDVAARLADYCQVGTPLAPLYEAWAAADGRAAAVARAIEGVRVLRQDPLECLVSFICSSNNNIPRITLMLKRLREAYGTRRVLPAAVVDDPSEEDDDDADDAADDAASALFDFPSLEALVEGCDEAALRAMGFGYRAPYVVESCRLVQDRGGTAWLDSLRRVDRQAARAALLDCKGVGAKVADCVALFSLDQPGTIPVDTHVWRIARRDFAHDHDLLTLGSNLTPAAYARVGDLFRDRFGKHAGWAHSLLFCAELPMFADALPEHIVAEQRAFKVLEKDLNAQLKLEKRDRAAAKAAKVFVDDEAETPTKKPRSPPKEEEQPFTPKKKEEPGDDSSDGDSEASSLECKPIVFNGTPPRRRKKTADDDPGVWSLKCEPTVVNGTPTRGPRDADDPGASSLACTPTVVNSTPTRGAGKKNQTNYILYEI